MQDLEYFTMNRIRYMDIFKRSTASLSAEFFFSYIGCNTKAKKLSLPYYLSTTGGEEIDPCLHE